MGQAGVNSGRAQVAEHAAENGFFPQRLLCSGLGIMREGTAKPHSIRGFPQLPAESFCLLREKADAMESGIKLQRDLDRSPLTEGLSSDNGNLA